MSGGGKGGQTIGFRYYLSILSGLCRGPVDEVYQLKGDDKLAWTGPATDDTKQFVTRPDLYGGDKKEGGIQGTFKVFMGQPDQVLPEGDFDLPKVKTSIGDDLISEFRGVVTVWFHGMVAALNPYIKTWTFRVRRAVAGWHDDNPWYPEKAIILLEGDVAEVTSEGNDIRAMNGAHILYECCTNPSWGRGLPRDMMGDTSFRKSADTLYNEGFGVCLAWYRKEDIDTFIQKMCDLIGASLYTDRETGLMTLDLIRGDYDPNTLPLFTPSTGLVDIQEDDNASSDSGFNEVIGTGRDPVSNKDFQIRAQNLAGFQAQQSVLSIDQDYKGAPTKAILSRLVLRDLTASASGLKKLTAHFDRRAWRIPPGGVFRISDPARGIDNLVVRAGEIDDGNMIDGTIKIKCVQDVFGLPATSYLEPVLSTWTPPDGAANPSPDTRLIEIGYRDLYLAVGAANAEIASPTEAWIGQLAAAPSPVSYQFDLATRADGAEYVIRSSGAFTGTAEIKNAITPLQNLMVFENQKSFHATNVGQALLLEDEIVHFVAYDESTGDASILRGCADTIPRAHPAGTRAWTIDDDMIGDSQTYDLGEIVNSKVLSRTSTEVLSIDDAPEDEVEMVGRQNRPYPPGKVRVNGTSIYDPIGTVAEPTITWATRNRLLQADVLLGHHEDSVAPEAGQSSTIRVYNGATVIRTQAGITATSWTYDAAMQLADTAPAVVFFELESERDGAKSWQRYRFSVRLHA